MSLDVHFDDADGPPVKIAIVNLTSGGLSGGYLKYLRDLIPLLRGDPRVARLDVFVPEGIELPECGPMRSWRARDGFAAHRALKRELAALSPDVVFFPTARMVDCGDVPTVVMVRNMEPLSVPFGGNTFRESIRNLVRALVARHACRKASRVIAVSRHVHEFVTQRWRVPAERVGLVYHGIDDGGISGPQPGAPEWERLRPFVFTAGSIRPARGLEDLLRAAPALLRVHPGLKIVIAGRADASSRPYEVRMHALAARLGIGEAVVWAGHLSAEDMAAAFQHCAAFVMTSRAEACPNVALEALSHGALVVSTTQAPMPEFFADAATYYEPRDAPGLASQVERTLRMADADAARARRAAMAGAAAFTLAAEADGTLAQLQLAISAGSAR